jgi:ankyrin repeat protein
MGSQAIVHLLLKHPQIDVNQVNKLNVTPLFVAANKGHVEVVQVMGGQNPNEALNPNNPKQPNENLCVCVCVCVCV